MISTKGRYALIIMLDILENDHGEPVRLKDIAERQELSEKYLEQIAVALRKGGMLGSSKGLHGGYFLEKAPEDISAGDILRLMEDSLAPAPCVAEGGNSCKRRDKCSNVVLWEKLNDAINSVVDHITLADMRDWQT